MPVAIVAIVALFCVYVMYTPRPPQRVAPLMTPAAPTIIQYGFDPPLPDRKPEVPKKRPSRMPVHGWKDKVATPGKAKNKGPVRPPISTFVFR